MMQALKFWSGEWQREITGITGYNKAIVSMEPSPILLGVGYIIGPRIASVMVGGGILDGSVSGAHDRLLRRGCSGYSAAGPAADFAVERRRDLGAVCPLHRGGRGRRRRHLEHAQRSAAHFRLGGRQPARHAIRQADGAAAWPEPIAICQCPWSWPARSVWCWRSPSRT